MLRSGGAHGKGKMRFLSPWRCIKLGFEGTLSDLYFMGRKMPNGSGLSPESGSTDPPVALFTPIEKLAVECLQFEASAAGIMQGIGKIKAIVKCIEQSPAGGNSGPSFFDGILFALRTAMVGQHIRRQALAKGEFGTFRETPGWPSL